MVPKGFALAGTLLAISERGLDAQGNILAFLVGGKTPGQFTVRRTDNFDISDAVLLPSGDLLLLERNSPCSAASASGSGASRSLPSRPELSSMVPRSSMPTSATKSTIWKASTPTSRRTVKRF